MKKPAFWAIAGAVFVMITGTLLHFTYEWFGGNFWASVGAVNESTWEHLKLLFFPMLAWTVIEYLVFGADTPGYLPIRAVSILLGMLSIVVIFYTYSGVLGFNIAAVDIGSFLSVWRWPSFSAGKSSRTRRHGAPECGRAYWPLCC